MEFSTLEKLPEPIAKKVRSGSKELEKILRKDPQGKRIREVIEWNLRGDVRATTFSDLRSGLILSFGADAGNTILNLLVNNDPKLLEMYKGIGIPNAVESFLRILLTLYGPVAKRAMLCSERPNDWVHAGSHFYSDEKRGVVMRTELLKGNGEKIFFDGTLDDYITLVFHILKNINQAEIEMIKETKAGRERVPIVRTENFARLEEEFHKLAKKVK